MRYRDRSEAGERLAEALGHLASTEGDAPPLVLGVPRGGVAVAAAVATAIGGQLDVVVARKLGAPGNPELAIGAVSELAEPVIDEQLVKGLGVSEDYLTRVIEEQRAEVARRSAQYRANRPRYDPAGRTVVVVDDGIATGSTLVAVLRAVKAAAPARLVCAAPVGSSSSLARLREEADEVICVSQPASFRAVGEWYDDFTQTTDAEVEAILAASPDS